tara:strand:- start:22371 stop:22646 length:276 start_codon:yes stop_codon:yes gene_type:complete
MVISKNDKKHGLYALLYLLAFAEFGCFCLAWAQSEHIMLMQEAYQLDMDESTSFWVHLWMYNINILTTVGILSGVVLTLGGMVYHFKKLDD